MDPADERFLVIDAVREVGRAVSAERERSAVRLGRPEIVISEGKLSYLVEQGFRTKDIANMFGCSRRTIERRMNRYQLSHLNSADYV